MYLRSLFSFAGFGLFSAGFADVLVTANKLPPRFVGMPHTWPPTCAQQRIYGPPYRARDGPQRLQNRRR